MTDHGTLPDSPPPRRVGPGPWVVGIAVVAALCVVVWGLGSGAPSAATDVEQVDAQYQKAQRGDLVETTTVQGAVSSGQVVALSVPASTSTTTSGAGTPGAGGSTGGAGTPGGNGAPPGGGGGRPSRPSTTLPPTTVPLGPSTTLAPTTTTSEPTTSTTVPGALVATPAMLRISRSRTPVASPAVVSASTPAAPTGAVGSDTLVLTSVAAVGTVLKSGDVAFSVNGRPTVVVVGTTPAWRTINASTNDGTDVQQLEEFLHAHGFTDGGALKVDGHMTSATVAAISAWQKSLGLTGTGSVPLGEVSFQPADVTVVSVALQVGAVVTAGTTVLDVRSGVPFVDVSTDESWAQPGERVVVSLGAGRTNGTVASLVSGIAHVELPSSSGAKDGETATVTLDRTKVKGELLVPTSAILLTDLEGPVVGVRRGDQLTQVRVDVLASSGRSAAVRPVTTGALRAGDTVRWY